MSGTCVALPATRDVYHVTTSVRQRETKTLPVPNHSTNVTYNLRPVIDGSEHFSGPETMVVPPSSTRNYELTYQPLTMTTDGKKHMVRHQGRMQRGAWGVQTPPPIRQVKKLWPNIFHSLSSGK